MTEAASGGPLIRLPSCLAGYYVDGRVEKQVWITKTLKNCTETFKNKFLVQKEGRNVRKVQHTRGVGKLSLNCLFAGRNNNNVLPGIN